MIFSDVFWSAIIATTIGSVLSLIGVWIANRQSKAQHKTTLDTASLQQQTSLSHDATQREKERKMSLRRDVYMPAADAILKAQTIIMRLSDPTTSLQEVASQLPNELYVISRTLAVGSDKTIQAMLTILDALGDTFEALVFKRATLMKPEEYLDITEFGINECEKFSQLIPPALIAIREEMELPFDQDAFSRTYGNNMKKRRDMLQAKIDAIRDGIFYIHEK